MRQLTFGVPYVSCPSCAGNNKATRFYVPVHLRGPIYVCMRVPVCIYVFIQMSMLAGVDSYLTDNIV